MEMSFIEKARPPGTEPELRAGPEIGSDVGQGFTDAEPGLGSEFAFGPK